MPELEAKKKAEDLGKARCSTTDPIATVMKMADGGFRPAYNFQFCTATSSQVIVGVDVETTGSDAGQAVPMAEQVEERYKTTPDEVLIDGGFAQHDQIDALEAPEKGCTVYAPVPKPRDPKVDRHAPKPGDSPAVAAWRAPGWRPRRPRRSTSAPQPPSASTPRREIGACTNCEVPRPAQGQGGGVVVCFGS